MTRRQVALRKYTEKVMESFERLEILEKWGVPTMLSNEERTALEFAARGWSHLEISFEMDLGQSTVTHYLIRAMKKIDFARLRFESLYQKLAPFCPNQETRANLLKVVGEHFSEWR